jgi:hypothetical protein
VWTVWSCTRSVYTPPANPFTALANRGRRISAYVRHGVRVRTYRDVTLFSHPQAQRFHVFVAVLKCHVYSIHQWYTCQGPTKTKIYNVDVLDLTRRILRCQPSLRFVSFRLTSQGKKTSYFNECYKYPRHMPSAIVITFLVIHARTICRK